MADSGRLARRDIWLEREEIWHVKARNGDGDSPIKAWAYTDQNEAVAMVERLLSSGGDGWRNLAPGQQLDPDAAEPSRPTDTGRDTHGSRQHRR